MTGKKGGREGREPERQIAFKVKKESFLRENARCTLLYVQIRSCFLLVKVQKFLFFAGAMKEIEEERFLFPFP